MHFSKSSLALGISFITLTNHFVAAKSVTVATPDLCRKDGWKSPPSTTLICSDASKVCRDLECNQDHNCAMNCKHKWGPVKSWQALDACLDLWTSPKCDSSIQDCCSKATCKRLFGGCPAGDTGCEF